MVPIGCHDSSALVIVYTTHILLCRVMESYQTGVGSSVTCLGDEDSYETM